MITSKIKDFIDKNKINLTTFENEAGLNRSVLYSILAGKSKNPSIENIHKIANALDCSIDELLGRDEFFKNYIKNYRSGIEYNGKLFYEVQGIVTKYVKDNNINKISFGDIIYLIEEIYEYSKNTNNQVLDEKFALWMLKNQLKLK
jgi:transcriptional regulator with XRE-family HTH domain